MRLLDFAQRLNGNRSINSSKFYMTASEQTLAIEHGLVVVFMGSDDALSFLGAIRGDYYCQKVWIMDDGTIRDDDAISEEEREDMSNAAIPTVRAVWHLQGASWLIKTEIPHATFDIYDDEKPEQIFCRGIVFALVDALPTNDKQQAALLGIDE